MRLFPGAHSIDIGIEIVHSSFPDWLFSVFDKSSAELLISFSLPASVSCVGSNGECSDFAPPSCRLWH